jgi:hypothetical protein
MKLTNFCFKTGHDMLCPNFPLIYVFVLPWACVFKVTFGNAAAAAFLKNLKICFLLKFNMICTFWIVLMCWCQKWFLKNKKNIISMYFGIKSYLKSTRNHTAKHTLSLFSGCFVSLLGFSQSSLLLSNMCLSGVFFNMYFGLSK